MSFIDDIVSIGKSVGGFLTGNSLGSQLAKTALLGLALNQVNKSVNKNNDVPRTPTISETREQYIPNTENSVPVVYGDAFVRGIITDAYQQDRKYMWYCITVCEVTGKTNLGTGADSVISFKDIYINKGRCTFASDGITVTQTQDDDGEINTAVNGLIKIYCFNNGSSSPVVPVGYSNGGLIAAYGLMPNWTSLHTMDKLAFALVRVEYNKEKSVTSLGEIEFKMNNTMFEPGDCVYDYMTNTRYGAGIPESEIYLQ